MKPGLHGCLSMLVGTINVRPLKLLIGSAVALPIQGERWNLGSFKACKAHMQAVSERPLDRDARVRLSNQARLADQAAILTLNFYGAEARQITVDELAHLPVRECLEIWRVSGPHMMQQQGPLSIA